VLNFPPISFQRKSPRPRKFSYFGNMLFFCCVGLLTLHPTTNLENHLLSAVRDCLLNIYRAAIYW
jgi:hypothetical protein